MRLRPRSLQLRLALRLGLVYLAATAFAAGLLIYRAVDTAGSLNDRELALRADDIAASVSPLGGSVPTLALPPSIAKAYEVAGNKDAYAVRLANGPVFAASPPAFGDRVKAWPAPGDDPSYFRVSGIGDTNESYYGLTVALDSAAGPLWVTVAHAGEASALVQSLLWEFEADLAWGFPVFVAVTLIIGVLVIRRSLKPLREVSRQAASIGPAATSVRLETEYLPAEIAPLVGAVNRAFDRLEEGFALQRQFTANAAHELRTPLAIVTAALDAMVGTAEISKLKGDVARMNRLVEQLLRVARLDALAPDVSSTVDLTAVAVDVVTMLAPWAIAQGRAIGFCGCDEPVLIRGNKPAIADAVRNLVENAVVHAPPGDEITIAVYAEGKLSVSDHGPGIAPADREHVFERFWRGSSRAGTGAGLGLAITREIMRAHGGIVRVEDNPGGGAVLTLDFARGASQSMSVERCFPRPLPRAASGSHGRGL
jgi:signal transduction histidine kinase